MKKLLFGAAAALLMAGAVSCNNAADNSSEIFSAEASDSLISVFGEFVGASMNTQILNAMVTDSSITKDAYIKGLMYAMGADTAMAYQAGMNLGLQIQGEFARFEKMGVKVDRMLWLSEFKKAFMADSAANQMEMTELQSQFQMWNDSLRNAKRAFDLKEIENSPESQANLEQGKKFIADAMAKDSNVKLDDDGMAYKIENPGEGKIADTDKVTLKVTAKALAGEDPRSIPSSAIFVKALPKGLQPAVTKLGKGGKGVFYIPGANLYEIDQAVRLGLAPNALYIYDVEVLDVEAPDASQREFAAPVKE